MEPEETVGQVNEYQRIMEAEENEGAYIEREELERRKEKVT